MGSEFGRLLEQFLTHIGVERGLAQSTVDAYASDLRRYLDWLEARGVHGPAAVTRQDVEDYVADLDGAGESGRSKARRLASIHAFHRFALAQQAVASDVAATVKAPKGAGTLPDVLTVDEVARLLEAVPQPGGAGVAGVEDAVLVRDRALLELMYATGARVSEIVGADIDDMDFDEHVIRVTGKGSKQRLVPVGGYACQALRRYLDEARPVLGRRKRSGSAERRALFLNKRGCRLSRQSVWEVVRDGRRTGAYRQAAAPAHAAPLLRHASDPGRGRRAHRAGAARPRLGHHHADLYACQPRIADRGLSDRPSARPLNATAPKTSAMARRMRRSDVSGHIVAIR